MNTVLQAQGLGKKYGRRWALTDCDLEVPAGHVVGLVGPNGAGKSTLLNLAVGMLTPTGVLLRWAEPHHCGQFSVGIDSSDSSAAR